MPLPRLAGTIAAIVGVNAKGQPAVRYDDMIGTVLDQATETPAAVAALWMQLVDVIAQGRGGPDVARGYAYLAQHRAAVPVAMRTRAARMLAGRRLPADLMRVLADDLPAVSAPLLATARLADAGWPDLLPQLTPTARGVLRHRRDLDAATQRALAAFGAVDLVLGAPAGAVAADAAPPVPPPAPVPDAPIGVSISALVKRIAAYRRETPLPTPATAMPAAPAADARVTAFRFEAGADGVIFWVDGAPRVAIVGETLAQAAAADAGQGVDGHVAGAFRRRSPFRDARLTIGGVGTAAGDWRISAVPVFGPSDGRFLGYRGSARRPRPDEVAVPLRRDGGLLGAGIAPDSLRQLVHELRTPLNAIVGFADMIAGQMLGPVGSDYRQHAGMIAADGRRLLAAVDDLDMAARLEGERIAVGAGRIEPVAMLRDIVARHAGRSAQDPQVDLTILHDPDGTRGDAILFDRMLSRLIAAAIGLAEPGERIAVSLDHDGAGGLLVLVARPARLAGRDERTLLDPGYAPDGDWPDAPLLGLGFSLRLVRNLAGIAGGTLAIDGDRFALRLPIADAGSEAGNA